MKKQRMSIVAENDVLLELRSLAQQKGVTFSEIVRCALTDYAVKNAPKKARLSFLGAGASGGRVKISENAEDLLFQKERRRS